MNLVLIISLAVLLVCAVLIAFQIRLFFRLKHKLKKANYNTYIDMLGTHRQFRPIDYETRRYKWSKGIFTIKASFDNDGNHVGDPTISRRFLRWSKRVS